MFYDYFLLMETLRLNFERAWRGVIAPAQYSYNINTICPREELIHGRIIERIDFMVCNDEGKQISCLILKDKHLSSQETVLYFHGNGGSKVQILGVIPQLALQGVALISFDFVGCGNSDPGYLTYGPQEASDAQIVLREAYGYINVQKLTLWGRSMGAITAITFAGKNPKIVDKLVLDSPFKQLQPLVRRVIEQETHLPHLLASLLCYFIRKEVEQRLNFPLFQVDYLHLFKKLPKNLSILFICSDNDTVVPRQEVEDFYRAFKGDRELLEIQESHEEDRGETVYGQVLQWVRRQKTRKNMKLRLYRPSELLSLEDDEVSTMC